MKFRPSNGSVRTNCSFTVCCTLERPRSSTGVDAVTVTSPAAASSVSATVSGTESPKNSAITSVGARTAAKVIIELKPRLDAIAEVEVIPRATALAGDHRLELLARHVGLELRHGPAGLRRMRGARDRADLTGLTRDEALARLRARLGVHPVVPESSSQIWKQLGLKDIGKFRLNQLKWGQLELGTKLGKVEPVFPRVDKSAIEKMHTLTECVKVYSS